MAAEIELLMKVLHYIASLPSPELQLTALLNLLPPFNAAVFTHFSNDFSVVNRASVALNSLLDSKPNKSLLILARGFVYYLTRSIISFYTLNLIVQQKNNEQRAILQGRKH